jgi:hypothetical protein
MTTRVVLDGIKKQTSRLLTSVAWPETPEERTDAEVGVIANVARLTAAVEAGLDRMETRAKMLRATADRLHQQVLDRDPERDHDAAIRYGHYALEAESGYQQLRAAIENALAPE